MGRAKGLLQTLEQAAPSFWIETVITGLAAQTHVYNADCPCKVRVIDCHYVMTQAGGGACTGRLDDGAANITDAMNINQVDNTLVRAAQIVNAAFDIDAGGTLDFTISAFAGETAGLLYTHLLVTD